MGLTHLAQEADILLAAATQRLLHSQDPAVAELAAAELTGAARRRVRRDPTPADLAEYLNGAPMRDDGGGVSCRSTRTRVATTALARRAAVRWRAADPPVLQVGEADVEPRRESRALREAVRRTDLADLTRLPQQGKVLSCVADQPVSSHYMYNGSFTRFADWRFVHRARLSLVPLNAYSRRPGADRRCRRCGYAAETLPHVLNHCLTAHAEAYQLRHDALLARLERAQGDDRAALVAAAQKALRNHAALMETEFFKAVDASGFAETRIRATILNALKGVAEALTKAA